MRYRAATACAIVLALATAVCGALGFGRTAWVLLGLALVAGQVARHYGNAIVTRGVGVVFRRALGGAPQTGGAPLLDTAAVTASVSEAFEKQREGEAQALRQLAGEIRALRLQNSSRPQ